MKKQLMTIAILGGLIIAVSASKAQAQIIDRLKADIPFNFYVGDKLLPAGEYAITEKAPGSGLMLIQRDDGKASAFFLTISTQERKRPTVSDLVFNKYGDEAFLTRVEEAGYTDAVELRKSKLEKEAARNEGEVSAISLLLHN